MIWEIIAISGFVVLMILAKIRKKSYFTPFLIGALYGLWWELAAEGEFNYTDFQILIYKDVGLALVIIWGVAIAGFIFISDIFQEKFPLFKKGKHMELKNCFLWDVIIATLLGFSMEILGSSYLNMWTYVPQDMPLIAYIPIRWLAGWGQIGLFIMAFVRRYDFIFEINWIKNKFEKTYKTKT